MQQQKIAHVFFFYSLLPCQSLWKQLQFDLSMCDGPVREVWRQWDMFVYPWRDQKQLLPRLFLKYLNLRNLTLSPIIFILLLFDAFRMIFNWRYIVCIEKLTLVLFKNVFFYTRSIVNKTWTADPRNLFQSFSIT